MFDHLTRVRTEFSRQAEIMSSATQAVLCYSVRTFGFQEIRAMAYTDNRTSICIMENIGMRVDRFDLKYNKQVRHYVWHPEAPQPQ